MPGRGSRCIEFSVRTTQRCELVEITRAIRDAAREVHDGYVIAYVPHTTAGVCINENADPEVKHDVLAKLERLIPKQEPFYRHGEGNSDSHLKTILTGNSVTVLVERGQPLLGQWQGIYLAEFDGPRTRTIWLKCVVTGADPKQET